MAEAAVQLVFGDILGKISKFRIALAQPEVLMRRLGFLGVAASQKAFKDQRLGTLEWPARYEGMDDPFINIAGTLADFNAGRIAPKSNRFQDRPALVDEGTLSKTIDVVESAANSVSWGSQKSYAMIHQEGGVSRQPITDSAKKRMKDWLYKYTKKRGYQYRKTKVKHYGRSGKGPVQKTERSAYAPKIEPLIYMSEWVQNVAARPFLGITQELAEDMLRTVKEYFRKVQGVQAMPSSGLSETV